MLPPPIIREHDNILVVRDDLIRYGSKARFLDSFFQTIREDEVVYGGSPRWGFAQISVAYLARKYKKKAVVFLAKAQELSPYSQRAVELGAEIVQVPMGFLSVCQKRAADYANIHDAFVLPLGLDHPLVLESIRKTATGLDVAPDEVWTVASSGTLTRGLQQAWPAAEFFAVQVGKGLEQENVGRATIIKCPQQFAQHAKRPPPFPSVPEYDAKAWSFIPKDGGKVRVFWNVGG